MGKSQFEQDMAKWPRSLKSRVSLDKEYEFVSRQVDANNARIWDAFKLYVQVMTVVVGGAVYAALTFKIDPKTREVLALLTSGMVFLITAVTIGIVLDCLRSWKGYRQAQYRLAGLRLDGQPHIDAPHASFPSRCGSERGPREFLAARDSTPRPGMPPICDSPQCRRSSRTTNRRCRPAPDHQPEG